MTDAKIEIKPALPFWLIVFFLILLASSVGVGQKQPEKIRPCDPDRTNGSGFSIGDVGSRYQSVPSQLGSGGPKSGDTVPLRIRRKPKAQYTKEARENCIEGDVVLRIEFLPDGTIGKIAVVQGLPHGLTKQAIAAARQLEFEPAKKRGRHVKVALKMSYNFTIY